MTKIKANFVFKQNFIEQQNLSTFSYCSGNSVESSVVQRSSRVVLVNNAHHNYYFQLSTTTVASLYSSVVKCTQS